MFVIECLQTDEKKNCHLIYFGRCIFFPSNIFVTCTENKNIRNTFVKTATFHFGTDYMKWFDSGARLVR